jgi:dCMP deaminase
MPKTASGFRQDGEGRRLLVSDLSWDEWFLLKCKTVALKSKDPTTKVGAIIVDDTRQLTEGYNGFPSRMLDDAILWERPKKYDYVIHAEENAIVWAARRGIAIEGGTMYCSLHPCAKCARLIAAAGIKEVVYDRQLEAGYTNRDFHAMDLAKDIFRKASVQLRSELCQ